MPADHASRPLEFKVKYTIFPEGFVPLGTVLLGGNFVYGALCAFYASFRFK
jgi:hypothetical protein